MDREQVRCIKIPMHFAEDWRPVEKKLIAAVQQYPIIFKRPIVSQRRYNQAVAEAWKRIAQLVGLPEKRCRMYWTEMKLELAKLRRLIREGRVSPEIVVHHTVTKKFFTQKMDTMSIYMDDIGNADIPPVIHQHYNVMFQTELTYSLTGEVIQAEGIQKDANGQYETADLREVYMIVERLLSSYHQQKTALRGVTNVNYSLHLKPGNLYETSVRAATPAPEIPFTVEDEDSTDLSEIMLNLTEKQQRVLKEKIAVKMRKLEKERYQINVKVYTRPVGEAVENRQ